MSDVAASAGVEQQYYALLDEFTDTCVNLAGGGLPYVAVVLCHELFRFLYPVDPYAHVTNDQDPAGRAVDRIRALIALGRASRDAISPYEFDPQRQAASWQAATLETSTSNLYSALWNEFDRRTLIDEPVELVRARVPQEVIARFIVDRRVLDMGCGSGRYTLALARLGAARAVGVDVQARSYQAAADLAASERLPVEFREGNVLNLPFPDESFDFVFCNGVIHHSASIERGLTELGRVLKRGGSAFLYLYAAGGFFWNTRTALRRVFQHIPLEYSKAVLQLIGMPSNRFIFCDTWYVPVETHTTQAELEAMLKRANLTYRKVPGQNPFDLDGIVEAGRIPGAREMWGDGEHRYVLARA